NKFWEVECEASSLTVRFGKIGTNGQTQQKKLASAAAAKKEHDKLVAEKLKKGYVEMAASVTIAIGPDDEWPPKTGILGPALRLCESPPKSSKPRGVVTGKVTFPAGGMKKWLAKNIRFRDETVGELVARTAELAQKGEHFLE